MHNMAQVQAVRQQQAPQYEFSTDEEAEFEEYGIQDDENEIDPDLYMPDEEEEEDLVYEDSEDNESVNPSSFNQTSYQ